MNKTVFTLLVEFCLIVVNKFGLHLPGMRGRSIFQQDRDEKDQLKNQIYLIRFGHTKALLFEEKNMTRNGHFSRPAETDPYVETKRCNG